MSYEHDHLNDIVVSERPWGQFEQFVANAPVTVKIITILPGRRLSLQRHAHRAEMWRCLDHPVDVEVEGQSPVLHPGETLIVTPGATHRLGTSGTLPARVLEIAFGDFDEADIERLHDDYAR